MQYISFFTATILNWKHLLLDDLYKDIIISSMKFLVSDKRTVIYAFVIMPNHIHVVWNIANDRKKEDVQRDFLKYTAQKMKLKLKDEDPEKLKTFFVGARDRKYQFWERNPLTSRLPSEELIVQKIIFFVVGDASLNTNNGGDPSTTIKYSIPNDANTTLNVYDALGQLIATLVNRYQIAGEYETTFIGENYPSGVYFYVLESGDFVSTKKMVLIK
ncbi:MAG: T9SS type A sorting domain-containing protein [Ignavibacteria bacterium]|nr:T9SS type A sorting domain-containing protein [Ignavibacteria bacterium]